MQHHKGTDHNNISSHFRKALSQELKTWNEYIEVKLEMDKDISVKTL